jgi:hypothetical protein
MTRGGKKVMTRGRRSKSRDRQKNNLYSRSQKRSMKSGESCKSSNIKSDTFIEKNTDSKE